MEITHHPAGDWLELRVRGRLDAYWADHFAAALDGLVRQGAHRLRLDLSEVVFLSSAGVGILLRFYKQLAGIQGKLTVSNPSEPVKKVLELSGLVTLLIAAPVPETVGERLPVAGRKVERGPVTFEVFEPDAAARLRCRLVGDPGLLEGCRFGPADCRTLRLSEASFALGLGALGDDFDDCRGRLGEFLAVAGAVAYLPTDGTNVPDYLVAKGTSAADLQVCYGVVCEGPFSRLARFETQGDAVVPLSELAAGCLELSGADAAGMVVVAEAAGLMGAALRRSPAGGPAAGAPFAFPPVRDWLSFTAERAFPRSLALVVGVAARSPDAALAPLLRPLDGPAGPAGHFHAAAFSYQPLPRGAVGLKETVSKLFEVQALQGVLHLLHDTRPIVGGGQSEFVRGACWVGPLGDVTAERT